MSVPKKDPIFAAIAAEEISCHRHSVICNAVGDIEKKVGRAQVSWRVDYSGSEASRSPIYVYSHADVDGWFDKEREFVRNSCGGRLPWSHYLPHNVRRARAHADLTQTTAEAEAANIASGFTRLDAARDEACGEWLAAEKRLFRTKPTTLAGMRAVLALAAKRSKQTYWDEPTLARFLRAMARQ